jgi:superfamily I DNA/RNA helicase
MPKLIIHKDIHKQVLKLKSQGGLFQKASEKLSSNIYHLQHTDDPRKILEEMTTTNNGENRINHCIKYDFPGYCRLITIQDNGFIVLLFFGSHDECDQWLYSHRGYTIATENLEKGLITYYQSSSLVDDEKIKPNPDYSGSHLYLKLKHLWDTFSNGLNQVIKNALENIKPDSEENDIIAIVELIIEKDKQITAFDVFMLLRGGKVDEAKNRILAYQDSLKKIEDLTEDEFKKLKSNDQYLTLDDLTSDEMRLLMSSKNMLDFMLFMHPDQKNVVERDFTGSARLLGVSGSGKTTVIVRRAVRLVQKYKGSKILILTLNEALARLIYQLVEKLLDSFEQIDLIDHIEVKSFWELCRELLIEHRQQDIDHKILGPKTHRHEDSIESVWEEYYKCENNNNDADVLFPLHQTLLAREVYPLEYIKQEMDWIRSFLPYENIEKYYDVARENRAVQLAESEREMILNGLEGWRKKMKAVGAIDYLGLANDLYPFMGQVNRRYRSILVDEIQDFGTLELSIIRKLVDVNENDLFLCGDIAQQVYNKHHQIRVAGINILPESYLKILKNYRNSREILSAAYAVYKSNVDESKLKTEDFEVLNPEFANFSSPKPFLRSTSSFTEEFLYACQYLKEILDIQEKGCIAICDYSIFEIEQLSIQLNIPILNGSDEIKSEDKIYLSDLDQTKGFEFDIMIIINVSNGIFPNPAFPVEERFREISKLYVAMTRAKKELVISYSKDISILFDNCKEYFSEDTWDKHCDLDDKRFQMPLKSKRNLDFKELSEMTGTDFLHHRKAVGTSKNLQAKLIELVSGKSITQNRKTIGWRNMHELKIDISQNRDIPHYSRLFGPNVYDELKTLIKKISI